MKNKKQTLKNLEKTGYEFYKFYTVFKSDLLENYAIDKEKYVDDEHKDFMQFPLYCFTAFIKSYCDYYGIYQDTD